jgi:hypothetical protein
VHAKITLCNRPRNGNHDRRTCRRLDFHGLNRLFGMCGYSDCSVAFRSVQEPSPNRLHRKHRSSSEKATTQDQGTENGPAYAQFPALSITNKPILFGALLPLGGVTALSGKSAMVTSCVVPYTPLLSISRVVHKL